jgi:hypothetical protein
MSSLYREVKSFGGIVKQQGAPRKIKLKPVIFLRCSSMFFCDNHLEKTPITINYASVVHIVTFFSTNYRGILGSCFVIYGNTHLLIVQQAAAQIGPTYFSLKSG